MKIKISKSKTGRSVKYPYQLTDWVESKKELRGSVSVLKEHNTGYKIKKRNDKKVAVFTVGESRAEVKADTSFDIDFGFAKMVISSAKREAT